MSLEIEIVKDYYKCQYKHAFLFRYTGGVHSIMNIYYLFNVLKKMGLFNMLKLYNIKMNFYFLKSTRGNRREGKTIL